MSPRPAPGYRYFECHECGKKWAEHVDDYLNPEQSPCRNRDCIAQCIPHQYRPDTPACKYRGCTIP